MNVDSEKNLAPDYFIFNVIVVVINPMKKKQIAFSLIGFVGLFACASSSKAWDFYDVVYSGNSSIGNHVYGVDSSTGVKTLLTTKLFTGNTYEAGTSFVDGKNRLSIVSGSVVHIYDPVSNSWNDITVFSGKAFGATPISQTADGAIAIGDDADSVVQVGTGSTPVSISSEGVSIGGSNLIKETSGTVSIGENSLKLREQGGRQQMWATNANGDSIDIDVVNGSRLLINGRDVEKSIDNVGALSAALGSVPTVSADSQFTCGFGGGTHSSAYAFSGGCASRVSDRVSVNAALATVVNNHTGDADDNLSARAGFTFRLGKIDDSPKVAARKAAELRDEVAKLRDENLSMRAESLMQKQINSSLAARLEQLERIASSHLSLLGDRVSSD